MGEFAETFRLLPRFVLRLALAGGALIGIVAAAHAEGALAIGNCGAYGFSYNYDTESAARERALDECRSHGGKNCKVVVSLSGNCAAFSIDNNRSCGAWGWASRANQDLADEAAIGECRKANGKSCGVRARVCDARSSPTNPSASNVAPAMTTNWTSTTLEQQECVDRASRVVKDANLTKNYEVVGQSVFGEEGDYTAQVRCITEKSIVMFVVIGPQLDKARQYMSAMFDKF